MIKIKVLGFWDAYKFNLWQNLFDLVRNYKSEYLDKRTKVLGKTFFLEKNKEVKIPWKKTAILDYISMIGPILYLTHITIREGGLTQTRQTLSELKEIFVLCGTVFTQAQTSTNAKPGGGYFGWFLKYIDPPFNQAPSLHVTLVSYIYMKLETHSKAKHGAIKKQIAKIIDSTLLLDQHTLFDVASGLYLAGGFFKENGEVLVKEIGENILRFSKIGNDLVQEIRGEILKDYHFIANECFGHKSTEKVIYAIKKRASEHF